MSPQRSNRKTRPGDFGRRRRPKVENPWRDRAVGGAAFLNPFRFRALRRMMVLCVLWGGLALGLVCAYYAIGLPDPRQAVALKRKPAITILAADGSVMARYGEMYGTTVTVEQLPKYVPEAVLATEDSRFYHHFGIDPIGLARAMFVNWRAGHMVQGGSTITQQLAKNLFLTPERTLGRKIQEAMLALWIEHLYTKDQILTGYLNRVYFGEGAYGIDAAAHTYFGKPATQLTLQEAATLAGCLKAPSHYNPDAAGNASVGRTRIVLLRMEEVGYITEDQLKKMDDTPPPPPQKPGSSADAYRYFADWIVDRLSDYIDRSDGDLTVATTFDMRLEHDCEHYLQTVLESKQATAAHASQGAVVTVAHDGAILAMVGGRDYNQSQFNRATQALRQPGSSFKAALLPGGAGKRHDAGHASAGCADHHRRLVAGEFRARVSRGNPVTRCAGLFD